MTDARPVILILNRDDNTAEIIARLARECPEVQVEVAFMDDTPTIHDMVPENVLTMKRHGNAYPEIFAAEIPLDPALRKRAFVSHDDKRPDFLKGSGARITSARGAR